MTTPIAKQDHLPATEAALSEREHARKRLEAKRKFWSDVFAYVVVNAFLVIAWAIGGGGSFWPGWVLAGWAVFLLIDGYRVFLSRPITDADIEEEMRRRR
jgi:hypothetical protein